MKHILHKNVNGKVGADGRTYFHVYVTFAVDRNSYRLKSQLVNRPITKEEYEELENLYEGKISDLLDKERAILFDCVERNTNNKNFDRNSFRKDYEKLSRSIIDIVREVRNTSSISDWTIPGISWELTKSIDIDSPDLKKNHTLNYSDKDLFELEVDLLEFQLAMRKNLSIEGLCLLYDWEQGNLKNLFGAFLKRQHSTNRSNELINLIQQIINKM